MRACAGGLEGKRPDRLVELQPVVLRLRGLDESEVLGDGHRLTPAGDAELPVDGDRLGLDRVPRDVEALADLPERQMRGEERKHAELGSCEPGVAPGTGLGYRGELELQPR